MTIRKLLFVTLLAVIGLATVLGLVAYLHATTQGLSNKDLLAYSKATIRRDDRGVLSINASDWLNLSEAQGFLVASERMFQLDLMRRRADGALSELFGEAAISFDRKQRAQDWKYYAKMAADHLPESQKTLCESYARGINYFLETYAGRAGVEYSLLRVDPKPWSCADSLLIVMLMSNNMSQSWSRDLEMKKWHDALPADWWSFVFPERHPWNRPWFESSEIKVAQSSWPADELPYSKLTDSDFQPESSGHQAVIDGSNSWAYRGPKGAWLANDPHLGNQVPQLWLPMRLETSDGWWSVGVALPGVPGILIGMNSNLAWAITNNGEDVDDAVLTPKNTPVEKDIRTIKVRGGNDINLEILRTEKGPIVEETKDGTLIVRQWITLKNGELTLPIEALNKSTDWASFNNALDDFRFVPLNFTMLDRQGNIGLRISGCDISRTNNGDYAEDWHLSQWSTECTTNERRRLYQPNDNSSPSAFISTANEQIWVDKKLHNWADDDRAYRIRELLSRSNDLSFVDMGLMQLDTVSHFHQRLISWLLENGTTEVLPENQRNDWKNWDGDTKNCPLCMSEANDGALLLDQIIMKKIEKQFAKNGEGLPKVRRNMDRARLVSLIENQNVASLLGLDSKALATGVMQSLARGAKTKREAWQIRNRWTTQHPFVGRIPIIGRLFAIDAPVQFGASTVLRAEKPHHGPSTRMIWSPADPTASAWAFPTGTSGHVLSPHYEDWSIIWQKGGLVAVPTQF